MNSFRSRTVLVALIVAATTFGMPGQLVASPRIPPTFARAIPVARAVQPGETATRAVPLPWRANMLGVSFVSPDGDGHGTELSARTRTDGVWSDWFPLETDGEDLPDGAERKHMSPRVASDPAWLGTVDGAEVRISVPGDAPPARDVRVDVINTLGDAKPRSLISRIARTVGDFLTLRPAPAEAIATKPSIISRSRWGATESWRDSAPRYADSVRMLFVHHTDTTNSYTRGQSAGIIRGIYRYHVFSRGFADVAYNFFVDRYGQIFEGRAGGIDKAVIGAHTLGFNTRTSGIAVLGNFVSTTPPAAATNALTKLAAWKMDVHHIRPASKVSMTSAGNERYPPGRVVTFNRISGHRDAKPTSCPGGRLYAKLPAIRVGAERIGHPKIYLNTVPAQVVRPDGDGTNEYIHIAASFSRTSVWKLAMRDSGGVVRKTWNGSGTTMSQKWTGLLTSGGPRVPTGFYTWTLTGVDTGGHSARAAIGSFSLVADHPDGSLLKDTARYTVSGGRRYDEGDATAFRSVFGALPAILTGPAERGRIIASPVGLALRDGALLSNTNDGSRWIWSAGTLRQFASDPGAGVDVFATLGYNSAALIGVSASYIAALPHGPLVDDTSVHPTGSVARDAANGKVFVIGAGTRSQIGAVARRSRYRLNEIVTATAGDLALPETTPVAPRDGAVVRAGSGAPWLISGGQKRRFVTSALFWAMGYTDAMLLPASSAQLADVPTGATFG